MRALRTTAAAVASVFLTLAGVSAAHAMTSSFPVTDGHASSVVVDPLSHRAFTLSSTTGRITVTDLTSGTTAGVLPYTYASVYDEAFLAVDPVLSRVYTVAERASTGSGLHYSVTAQSEEPGVGFSSSVRFPTGVRPTAVAVDSFSHVVFVATTETSGPFQINRLQRLVPDRDASLAPAPEAITRLPNGAPPASIAVDPLLRQVYLSNPAAGTVSIVDSVTGAYKAADVRVGTAPHGLAVDAQSHEVFVADSGSGDVIAIDGATRTTVGAAVPVPGAPEEIDVDQLSGRVYVRMGPGPSVGAIAVLDGQTHELRDGALSVGAARDVAVDQLTHTVYAALRDGDTVEAVTG